MGYTSRLTLQILIFVCCVVIVKSEQECTVICHDGQYCSDSSCPACSHGTFQSEPIHSYISCKPWTDKSRELHYIIAENGTAKTDVKWRCEDGYEERQYTTQGFECRRIPPTTPSSVSSPTQLATAETVVTTEPSTAASHVHQQSDRDIAGPVVGGLVGLFAVLAVIAVLCCWRRHILCFANNNVPSDATRHHILHCVCIDGESALSSETEPFMLNPRSVNYKFCSVFVEELGPYKSVSFLEVLYDPSGKFDAGKVLQSESSKTPEANTYLTKTLLKWVELNKGICRSLIVDALAAISRTLVLDRVEQSVPITYLDETITDNLVSTANGQGPSSAGRVVLKQDRFRMYYYLTDHIQTANLKELLTQLSDSSGRFNALYHYDGKLIEDKDTRNAFAHTFEEWCLRNPNMSFSNILIDFLTENRRDVLENKEFQDCLQRIDPTETGNSDSYDQVQCGPSGNLIPDEANQVSTTAEIEHVSDDTETEDMPDDTEIEDIPDNTEVKQLAGTSEMGYMPHNTAVKQVSDDIEMGRVSANTAVKQLSDDNEMGRVSANTAVKQLSDDNEMGRVSANTAVKQLSDDNEMGCVSANTAVKQLSDDNEMGRVLANTAVKQLSDDNEMGHVSANTAVKQFIR